MSVSVSQRASYAVLTALKRVGVPVPPPSVEDLSKHLFGHQWTVEGKTHVFYTHPDYTAMLYGGLSRPDDLSPLGVDRFITISDTPGGRWLQRQFDVWQLPRNDELRLWALASSPYASSAKGEAVALVFGDTDRSFFQWPARIEAGLSRDEERASDWKRRQAESGLLFDATHEKLSSYAPNSSVWQTIELPNLLNNPHITAINNVPASTLRDYRDNSPSESLAYTRISRDLGAAILNPETSPLPPPSTPLPPFGSPPQNAPPVPVSLLDLEAHSRQRAEGLSNPISSWAYEVSKNSSEAARATCITMQTIPGGMLLPTVAVVPVPVSSIELTHQFGDVLLINGKYRFSTGLSPEEIAVLYRAVQDDTLRENRFGATSYREIVGTSPNNIVGLWLTKAELRFGEIVWGQTIDGSVVDKSMANPFVQRLSALAGGDWGAIERVSPRYRDNISPSVFLECPRCVFEVCDGTFRMTSAKVQFSRVLYKDLRGPNAEVLRFGSEAEEAAAYSRYFPEYAESTDRFYAQLNELLTSNELFARYVRYGAVLSLFRALRDNSGQLAVPERIERAYQLRVEATVTDGEIEERETERGQMALAAMYHLCKLGADPKGPSGGWTHTRFETYVHALLHLGLIAERPETTVPYFRDMLVKTQHPACAHAIACLAKQFSDKDASEGALRDAIAVAPKFRDLHETLVQHLVRMERFEEAHRYCQDHRSSFGGCFEVYDAWLTRLALTASARREVGRNIRDPDSWDNLVKACELIGDAAGAKHARQQAENLRKRDG